MTHARLTPLAQSLPPTVPFVGPETQERALGVPFLARIGANESVFGPAPAAQAALSDTAIWKYGDPTSHDLIAALAEQIKQGKIAAVKNTSGYLLIADATQARAIQQLRDRKKRPDKPFALLYENLSEVIRDFRVSPTEEEALTGMVRPIVLLEPKENTKERIAAVAKMRKTIEVVWAIFARIAHKSIIFRFRYIKNPTNMP